MWGPRRLLLVGLVVLGGLLLAGFLGVNWGRAQAESSSGCSAHYHPVASCSVPSGGTLDPCGILSVGVTHCKFTLPDFNPADWLGWLSCSIAADASAIWNAISGDVGSFLVTTGQGLLFAFEAPINQLIALFQGVLTGIISATGTFFTALFSSVSNSVSGLGPFAPLAVVVVTMGIIVAALIGLYFVVIFTFAVGKTIFNLL